VPFQLASSAGDLSGTIAIVTQPKLSVSGAVTSQRLDLDVLKAGGGGAGDGAARPSGAPAAPSAGGRAGPVIPDTPLPFAALHQADADLTMTIAVLHVGGTDIKDIAATVALKDGTLRIDPLSIADPNDRLTASVVVDAATVPASVHLILHTPGIATKPLLALFGLPEAVSGAAEITADLTGTGNSPHEIAATLNGWFGLAIPSGQLDAKLIDKWLEKLRPLQIPGEMTALRCLAVRADMKAGVAAIRPVALSTPGLVLDGTGDVYLGPETLALRLRPRAAIGGTGVAVPVKIGGTLRDPKASVDIAPDSAAGGLAGLLLGGKGLLGDLGGGDPCPAALARARDVAAPAEAAPKPAAAPSVPGLPKGVAPAATDMFRRLLPGVGR
jgi:AsmA protein